MDFIDEVDLRYTPNDVQCAWCKKEIPHNTQAFFRDVWLCSMKCVEESKPFAYLAQETK